VVRADRRDGLYRRADVTPCGAADPGGHFTGRLNALRWTGVRTDGVTSDASGGPAGGGVSAGQGRRGAGLPDFGLRLDDSASSLSVSLI